MLDLIDIVHILLVLRTLVLVNLMWDSLVELLHKLVCMFRMLQRHCKYWYMVKLKLVQEGIDCLYHKHYLLGHWLILYTDQLVECNHLEYKDYYHYMNKSNCIDYSHIFHLQVLGNLQHKQVCMSHMFH